MTPPKKNFGLLILGFVLALALAACSGGGGGGDSDDSTVQGRGTVGILLTDMPADPALFESINASIRKVELLGSEEHGRIVIYSGPDKTFDLLRLRNESIPLAFKDDVPAGTYCKIRLTLSDLELVLADDTPANPDDNERHYPKLPGNGKLDLLARDCFDVVADNVLMLQLDMDAGKSIHVTANGKGYNFRPVIFIDVVDHTFDGKLLRLRGLIESVDAANRSLLLCDALPAEDMDNLGCVEVHFGDDSAFFDNLEYDGAPRRVEELLSADNLGQEVTVVGWPSPGHVSRSGGAYAARHLPLLKLDALVAELGDFLQLDGTVAVDADPAGFAMTLSSGGPIVAGDTLAVMFQPGGSDFNGTRIVSKRGVLLDTPQVVVPLPVQVDGILHLIPMSDPVLKAALVIVDRGAVGVEQVTGVIVAVGDGTLTIDPEADTVCGIATDSLLVQLADETEILTVIITDDDVTIAPGGVPAVGQQVGMTGSCDGGDYRTDNLVIVDDRR